MPLPERRAPTHTLVIEVPLHVEEGQEFEIDPFQHALQLVLSLSRVATLGVLCDDPQVTLNDASAPHPR